MPLAPLTAADVRRIARVSGRPLEEFVDVRRIDPEERAEWERQDPVLRGLVGAEGIVRSLAVREGACVFLRRGEGCSLGPDRPLLCHRFPLVRRRGRLAVEPGGACLACEEAPDLETLLESLGLDRAVLARLDAAIRRAVRGEGEGE